MVVVLLETRSTTTRRVIMGILSAGPFDDWDETKEEAGKGKK